MIKELKSWLKKPGNSSAKIAYLLGYRTGTTVSNWIYRNSIPEYIKPQLKNLLKD